MGGGGKCLQLLVYAGHPPIRIMGRFGASLRASMSTTSKQQVKKKKDHINISAFAKIEPRCLQASMMS